MNSILKDVQKKTWEFCTNQDITPSTHARVSLAGVTSPFQENPNTHRPRWSVLLEVHRVWIMLYETANTWGSRNQIKTRVLFCNNSNISKFWTAERRQKYHRFPRSVLVYVLIVKTRMLKFSPCSATCSARLKFCGHLLLRTFGLRSCLWWNVTF